jgi:choline dehydrogenase
MLSGIGPRAHLGSHSIPVIHDLPGVGAGLKDHPCVNLRFRDRAGNSINYLKGPKSVAEIFKMAKAVFQFNVLGAGPLTSNVAEAAAFVRSRDPVLFADADPTLAGSSSASAEADATSGPEAPDVELIASPMAWTEHGHGYVPGGDLVSFGAVLLRYVPGSCQFVLITQALTRITQSY